MTESLKREEWLMIDWAAKAETAIQVAHDALQEAIELFGENSDEAAHFADSEDAVRDVANWAAYEGRLCGAQDVLARLLALVREDETLRRDHE